MAKRYVGRAHGSAKRGKGITSQAAAQGAKGISGGRKQKLQRTAGKFIDAAKVDRKQVKEKMGEKNLRQAARKALGLMSKGQRTGITGYGRNATNARRNMVLSLSAMAAG